VFDIDPELCTGCSLCAKNCPNGAVIGKRKFAHSIIVDRCTGCGACADACPKQAVLAVA
jgi:Na+-translocating ferredoxin:NAD+ oxidoreductase RNF subunit RnfB